MIPTPRIAGALERAIDMGTPAKEPSEDRLPPTAGSPSSCLQCRHHVEYMTHLTATVRCRFPRERDQRVVDMTIFLHGNAVMPIKAAVICPHFESPITPENAGGDAPGATEQNLK